MVTNEPHEARHASKTRKKKKGELLPEGSPPPM
jgi:hypothetical protein